MKLFKLLSISIVLLLFNSCATVQVKTDYDTHTDFSKIKSFAFYKKGIDKAKISDLDKRRILHAIASELEAKGLVLSDNPDMLVSIFTKSRKKQDVYYSGYWYPSYYGNYWGTHVSNYTEGTLLIDFIDTKGKKLLWQGVGKGYLNTSGNVERKEARINEFVKEMMAKYPPEVKK